MRVCVVGAGAIGGWIAARLALGGTDVSVVARGETLRAIETEGLRIIDEHERRCVAVAADADPAALGRHDVVIVAVKAPALNHIAPALEPLIGPETLIVPMLNGVPWWFTGDLLASVDPDGAIADSLPFEQLIGCVVHASCRREAPNEVLVVHAERLILGEPDGGDSDRVDWLCTLFANCNIRCDASDNIRRAIWYKLWGNATINPLSALTRSTADKLLDDRFIRGFMAEAMDELAAVGAAIGCPISESSDDRMAVTARLGPFRSSMLQDVEAGRPLEVEALLGAPREIAMRVDVPTPQLDRIYAMTRLLAENLDLA
ncbi:MAG TPA: 2-dehydropantoate 2-reductase [Sphingomicrobium sp.]|nr:2-dehydropantoate 2-reductase [Sphingomicrobium sp.]